jgi:hypothetical protein
MAWREELSRVLAESGMNSPGCGVPDFNAEAQRRRAEGGQVAWN